MQGIRNKPVLFVFALLIVGLPLGAQEKFLNKYVQPLQDVFLTDLVYPQDKNEIQLSLFPMFQRFDSRNYFRFPFVMEYGLTNSWQVEFGYTGSQRTLFQNGNSMQEKGTIELGSQYSFMNVDNTNFHAAIGCEIGLENNKEKNKWEAEFEPYILGAYDLKTFGNAQVFCALGAGFSVDRVEDNENTDGDGIEMNLGGGIFHPSDKFIFTAEFNWSTQKWRGGEEQQFYFAPGLVIRLSKGWEAGIGIPVGFQNTLATTGAIIILTYEFSLNEDND